jgi:hypothetical protein
MEKEIELKGIPTLDAICRVAKTKRGELKKEA